jgi:hypothetical protein
VKELKEGFKWDTIFDDANGPNSTLYSLEIIVNVLMADQSTTDLAQWVKRFLELGGLEQL